MKAISRTWDYLTISKFPFIFFAFLVVFCILPIFVWQATYISIDSQKGAYFEGWFEITTYPRIIWLNYNWSFSEPHRAVGLVGGLVTLFLMRVSYLRGK